MKRYYFPTAGAIVYADENADGAFWDQHWQEQGDWLASVTPRASRLSRPIRLISRYADKSGRILEAGCGMGQYVHWLHHNGYTCTGVDFASDTVVKLNQHYPELDVQQMDVFDLAAFDDASFDLYYSGGIIEHFWGGYDGVIAEAHRILRPGGSMVLTFPFMSWIRRRRGPRLPRLTSMPEGFYQFALDADMVIAKLADSYGYRVIHRDARNGLKGLIETYPPFRLLQPLQRYSGSSRIVRGIRMILSTALAKVGFGHSTEIVLKKPG